MQITYRDILNQAYIDRSSLNTSYSMRSFARDLAVSPSTLSEVINGKKGISPKRASEFAKKLKLPEWQIQFFCDLVSAEHAKSPNKRNEAKYRLENLKQENTVKILNQSAIRALTSWIDLAILELTYLNDFEFSTPWISKKIGASKDAVAQSMERLKASQLIKFDDSSKRWIDVSPLFSTTDGIPSDSIKRFHKSVLNLAISKIDTAPIEERTIKSAVISISESNKIKAKKILDEALSKIVALADESQQTRTDVMCFSIQLFSVLEKKESL